MTFVINSKSFRLADCNNLKPSYIRICYTNKQPTRTDRNGNPSMCCQVEWNIPSDSLFTATNMHVSTSGERVVKKPKQTKQKEIQ